MVAELSCDPQDRMLRGQLSGKSKSRQARVQAVLKPPGPELALRVEPTTAKAVTHDVVDRPESVKRASGPTIENGMEPVAITHGN